MAEYPGNRKAESADIALIVESSYPYILGGVSTWVEQILQSFPQYTFALIFLGGSPENYAEGIRYTIPDNVVHFQVHYLFNEDKPHSFFNKQEMSHSHSVEETMLNVHRSFRCPHNQDAINQIGNLSLYQRGIGLDYEQFLYSETSWEIITALYEENCDDTSFIDYFWTIRNIHKPLWILAGIVDLFPKVKLVHTASTGYAGLLAFLINRHFGYNVVLSEHGIYTRERRIDIFLSSNFRDDYVIDRPLSDLSYLRNLWDRYFKTLAQLCYNIANPIVSLSGTAHAIQVEEGADPDKTIVIPNGVDIPRFKALRRTYAEKKPIVCFVGRVVPMKDVKGFIRAIPRVNDVIPDSRFWIIGSIDQDPNYAAECHALVENISLQEVVQFQLHQNMNEVMPKVRVMVLSAIREGMPFVLLESFAAGIPVVATDVGACREMVLGLEEDDIALGPAGIIVKVADTKALEDAIIELLNDQEKWEAMSKSAILRAERYYDQKMVIERYATVYKQRIA